MSPADVAQMFRQAVLYDLGHAPELIEPGRLHRFSTASHGRGSSGWCKLFEDLSGGVYGCFRFGVSKTWFSRGRETLERAQRLALARQVMVAAEERRAGERARWAENAKRIDALWATCRPLQPGDPAALYLARRGLGIELQLPVCLRFHPSLPYWEAGGLLGNFPAMVATLVAPDGRTVALHRTYLTEGGCKADVPMAKKLTRAAGSLAGAYIPLRAPRAGAIGVAEGIETALAGEQASGVPTVAAYCAGNLASFHWPAGVRSLLILADADDAGRQAAAKLRQRAAAAGLRVRVLAPECDGDDWCDVWARRPAKVDEVVT
jgi:hypothetical protein